MFILPLVLWMASTNICLAQYFINRPNHNLQEFKFPSENKELPIVFEWKNIQYGFPSEQEREQVLRNGRYNPDSPIPIDIDVYYPRNGGPARHFVTTPRFGQGVPYSLAYVTNVQGRNGSEIQAYPSYQWHSSHGANCDGLTSVYRVHIDPCGRMWVLDSGEIEFVQHCAPQVVVFDLATDQLVHRYRLPETSYKAKVSRFVNILVDTRDPPPKGQCNDVFAYLADPTSKAIVVYDVAGQSSWRIENKFTYPDAKFGTHTVAGESFELLDGPLALAVTPLGLGMRRHLIFHALSNELELAIPLDILNNATNWQSGLSASLSEFVSLGRRGVQCASHAMSRRGILFCGFLEPIGIFGWDIRTPYNRQSVQLLALNPDTLQFVSGMKIVQRPADGREELWLLSDRLQKIFAGTIDYREINYRVLRCDVDDLLQGRGCF
ncbi:protein yellow [Drosophila gunungcola]|uniref:protein yellow n=1 Tax=Drosophila gunungcola TaxID=103775 RepID=UPI0022DFD919|nr:protein yellow [Drosophila gunungcola]